MAAVKHCQIFQYIEWQSCRQAIQFIKQSKERQEFTGKLCKLWSWTTGWTIFAILVWLKYAGNQQSFLMCTDRRAERMHTCALFHPTVPPIAAVWNTQLLVYGPFSCIFTRCLKTGQRTCLCHWQLCGQIKLCTFYYASEVLCTGKGKLISLSSFSCAAPSHAWCGGLYSVAQVGLSVLRREINKWSCLWKATKLASNFHEFSINVKAVILIQFFKP